MESAEHAWIGDQLSLQFGLRTMNAKDHYFKIGPGKQLTYGLIVALSGDLYGVVGGPISTAADPSKAFLNAWDSLVNGDNRELQEILGIMREEITAFEQAVTAGVDPSTTVYRALGDSLSHRWNGATGGTYNSTWIPPGRYLRLSAENWDHFSSTAVAAYKAGHQLAMEQAVRARASGRDQDALERELGLAYAMNAYADHFLTDLFSAGHLRVPRKEIYELADRDAMLGDVELALTGVLVRGMHDEDSGNGLTVTNAAGTTWRAYGDKRLLDAVSKDNAAMVVRAAQASADDIAAAFMSGEFEQSALQFIPDLAALAKPGDKDNHVNPSPLFTMRQGRVARRNDLANTDDFSWTTDWDALETWWHLPGRPTPETKYSHAKCYVKKDQKFAGWLSSTRDGNALIARTEADAHGVCWAFTGADLYLQKDTSGGERWLGLGNRNYASWGIGGGYYAPVIYNKNGTIALKNDPTRLLFLDSDDRGDWLSWTQPGTDNDNILVVALTVPGMNPDC